MGSNQVDGALALHAEAVGRALGGLDEDQWFERKSIRTMPRKLAEALVAFANAEGGTVVVGVHGGEVEGISDAPKRVNDLRQSPLDLTSPPVRARFSEVDVFTAEGRADRLLVARVEPGEVVHELTNGDCYLRIGDESRRLNHTQRQELAYDRGSGPYDGTALAEVEVADLDDAQLEAYGAALGSTMSVAQMLHARSLLRARGEVTVAAYLLFAQSPQRLLPHAHVRVLKYRATERGSGSRQTLDSERDERIEGSVPFVIHEAASVVREWVPKRRALTSSGVFADIDIVPTDAWLEGLVNAVVHRSYSAAGDHIRFEIFPDRIMIESPGRFPGLVDTDKPLEINRFARNPRIARVCHDLAITQELGEGIKRIVDEMRRAGLTDPVYRQTAGSVRLTLAAVSRLDPAVAKRLPRSAPAVVQYLRTGSGPFGTGDIQQGLGLSRPTVTKALKALLAEELVAWNGKSQNDPRATWSLPDS